MATIDLRTVAIEPRRQAYDHLIRRFGDKPASRYQEGSYDIQATENLHYRPTWAPEQELYDPNLSRIRMADWHALKDPRQFYYSTYTLTRSRQQDTADANFTFVENQKMLDLIAPDQRDLIASVLLPLRHAAWGANQNNTFVCGYGYGVTFTQPCMYHAMDNLGIAQYLSQLGLLLGGTDLLNSAREAWQDDPVWQDLRRYVEDVMANRDPVEVFIAQNIVLDGLLYPAIYQNFVGEYLPTRGVASVAMLTQFQLAWFTEGSKWLDATVKGMAAESDENAAVLAEWLGTWVPRARAALAPIVDLALGDEGGAALDRAEEALRARLAKAGLSQWGEN